MEPRAKAITLTVLMIVPHSCCQDQQNHNLLISLILSRNLETALCTCIQPVLLRKTTLEVDCKQLIMTRTDLFVVC